MKELLILSILVWGANVKNYLYINEEYFMCISLSIFFIVCIVKSKWTILRYMCQEIKKVYSFYYQLFKNNEQMLETMQQEIVYIVDKSEMVESKEKVNGFKFKKLLIKYDQVKENWNVMVTCEPYRTKIINAQRVISKKINSYRPSKTNIIEYKNISVKVIC